MGVMPGLLWMRKRLWCPRDRRTGPRSPGAQTPCSSRTHAWPCGTSSGSAALEGPLTSLSSACRGGRGNSSFGFWRRGTSAWGLCAVRPGAAAAALPAPPTLCSWGHRVCVSLSSRTPGEQEADVFMAPQLGAEGKHHPPTHRPLLQAQEHLLGTFSVCGSGPASAPPRRWGLWCVYST